MADDGPEGTWLTVENFPPELKRRLKANAAMEGATMRESVIAAVDGWCDEREAVRSALTEISERGAGNAGR